MSVNSRGLNKAPKRRTVFRGGEVFFSHGTNHSKGTMILIKPKINCKVEKQICDKNGRFLIFLLFLIIL